MKKLVLLAVLAFAAPAYAAPLTQNEAMAAYQAAGIQAVGDRQGGGRLRRPGQAEPRSHRARWVLSAMR